MKAGDKVSVFGQHSGTVLKDPKPGASLVLVKWTAAKVHYRALVARTDLELITTPQEATP